MSSHTAGPLARAGGSAGQRCADACSLASARIPAAPPATSVRRLTFDDVSCGMLSSSLAALRGEYLPGDYSARTRLRTGVVDELFRRPFAPLRDEGFLDRDKVRAVGEVEAVAVSPVLVHAAPRIGPIVIDLAAEHMPPDAPHVLVVAELLEIVVAHADVVDVLHLERQVVQSGLLMRQAEEDVMVDIVIAAVAAVERTNQVVAVAGIDVVGADEAQHLTIPGDGLAEFRRVQHAVADALDVRRAFRQPHQFAGAQQRVLAGVEFL